MSSLQPFWDSLAEADRELSIALAEHQAELKRLQEAAKVRIKMARALGRDDIAEQLEAVLAAADSWLDGKDVEGADRDETAEPLSDDPVEEPVESVCPPTEEPAIPAQEVLALPKVKPARQSAASGQIKLFLKRQSAFFDGERSMPDSDSDQPAFQFRVRSLICQARGLIRWAEDHDQATNSLDDSLLHLRNRQHGQFFGLNLMRSHSWEQWQELADAYGFLAISEDALAWDGILDLDAEERRELVDRLAAANTYLPRLNHDHGFQFTDADQFRQRDAIEKLRIPGVYIAWFRFEDEAPPLAHLKKRAEDLGPWLQDRMGRLRKKANRDVARASLAKLVEAIEGEDAPEDFIGLLRSLAEECLTNGVRPSEAEFLRMLLPYRHHLGGLKCPNAGQLETYLSREETKLVAKKVVVADPDLPEQDAKVAEPLRRELHGKAILMIGGRSDKARVKALSDALGCRVEWPDSHDDTKTEAFRAAVDRSDIVCRFIRWSRHSYKDVLDWATEQGKPTITFKAGSGVNRVVHDMAHQLRVSESKAG